MAGSGLGGGCGGAGIKDVCQVAVGFLHEVCLSRFSLSMCKRGFQAVLSNGTDTWFRNVGILHIDAGETPKRTYTIFKLR